MSLRKSEIIFKLCQKLAEYPSFCTVHPKSLVFVLGKIVTRITKQKDLYTVSVRLTPVKVKDGKVEKDNLFFCATDELGEHRHNTEANLAMLFDYVQNAPPPAQAYQKLFDVEF